MKTLTEKIEADYGKALYRAPVIITSETPSGRHSTVYGVVEHGDMSVDVCALRTEDDLTELTAGRMKAELSIRLNKKNILEIMDYDACLTYLTLRELDPDFKVIEEYNLGLLPSYQKVTVVGSPHTIAGGGRVYSNNVRNCECPMTGQDRGNTPYDYADSRFDNKYILPPTHFKTDYLVVEQWTVSGYMPPRGLRINLDALVQFPEDKALEIAGLLSYIRDIHVTKKERRPGIRDTGKGLGVERTVWKIVS